MDTAVFQWFSATRTLSVAISGEMPEELSKVIGSNEWKSDFFTGGEP